MKLIFLIIRPHITLMLNYGNIPHIYIFPWKWMKPQSLSHTNLCCEHCFFFSKIWHLVYFLELPNLRPKWPKVISFGGFFKIKIVRFRQYVPAYPSPKNSRIPKKNFYFPLQSIVKFV